MAVATHAGMGVHVIFATNLVDFAKSVLAIECSYSTTIFLTKAAILALYCRIFPTRSIVLWSYIIGTIVALYSISLIVVSLTACIPLKKWWDPLAEGWCMNTSIPFTTLA
jgi:hypothetical protein